MPKTTIASTTGPKYKSEYNKFVHDNIGKMKGATQIEKMSEVAELWKKTKNAKKAKKAKP